jgi:hypothetical protein
MFENQRNYAIPTKKCSIYRQKNSQPPLVGTLIL